GRADVSNIPDLKRDSLLAFQHRYYVPLAVALNIGLPLLLGILSHDVWGMLILAGVLRLVWSHHVTFFINSLAHMWGSRPYTEDNRDRKSTRLNSSHVEISYAVFCLKKKNYYSALTPNSTLSFSINYYRLSSD